MHRLRALSKQRHWALDLRLSLLVLFLLAWIAQKGGASILIAGFGAGVMVALIGGPKRLSTQMRGIAEGFFIPLYFVVLGAQLDLGGLFDHPSLLALAGALAALNVVIHLLAVLLAAPPLATGLVATAQLGVPAAIASLGLSEHVLSADVATAIVAAALVSLGVCTIGVARGSCACSRRRLRRSARQQRPDLPRDLEILARGDHERRTLARPPPICRSSAVASSRSIALRSRPLPGTQARRLSAHGPRRVLADAAGEHERVEAAERSGHRGEPARSRCT